MNPMEMARYTSVLLAAVLLLSGCEGNAVAELDDDPTDGAFGEGDFERVKYNNPDAVVDLGAGLWAHPLPMDFDGDGDMDLLVSTTNAPSPGLYFFENTSGETFPVFEPAVRIGDAIRNVQVSFVDGEPVVLEPGGILINFRETLAEDIETLFPADTLTKDIDRNRFNQWKLVDYENDGDLDVLIGFDSWDDYGWDNAYNDAGEWTNGPLRGWAYLFVNRDGEYVNQGPVEAGGEPIDVYGSPSPNIADFDGDGDLDLVFGEFLDRLTWFENTGTREQPEYASGRFLANEEGIIRMDLEMIIPVSVDWDQDGDVDLIVGEEDGRVAFIENTGKVKDNMPVFKSPAYFKQKADDLKFRVLTTPVGVDWDDDGDEDIITGNTAGHLAFIENLDGGYPPRWAPPKMLEADGEMILVLAGDSGSIQGPAEAKWGYTVPSVADWDGDGLRDIVINSIWGKVEWYRNVGEEGAPELAAAQPVRVAWDGEPQKPEWNWWDPEEGTLTTQWRTTPYAIDWNEDGLTDLVMLDHEGYLSLFQRFERDGELLLRPPRRIFHGADASEYQRRNEAVNEESGPLRLNAEKHGRSGRRKFVFADWDQDGDLDLLVNSTNVNLFRNEGVEDGNVVYRHEGPVAERRLAGHTTNPTMVDWNGDGVPDLLVGAEDGHFYYLENQQ